MQNLIIISNEKFSQTDNNYFCNNKDLKTLPEGLSKFFKVKLIARRSGYSQFFKLNNELLEIKVFSNILNFLSAIKHTFAEKNNKYLIISLSPYTFLASMLLLFFGKSKYLYLRSNGFEEYKAILGFLGPVIYGFMFYFSIFNTNLIAVSKRILRGKLGKIIQPSQLTQIWMVNRKKIKPSKPKLLYVGRIRKEKGIFSLAKIISKDLDLKLQIVGNDESKSRISQSNIEVSKIEFDEQKLIQFYDNHNIFILPSFTEGYPMVVLEALARLRPTIVFKEIAHIVEDKKGVFVSERDLISLKQTISYILDNYQTIQSEIENQTLVSRKQFIDNFAKILNEN